MVLEHPTPAEKKRFDELQRQGLLPSEALKKIETERRLGITPEEKSGIFPTITRENWWFFAGIGALTIGYLYFRLKPAPSTQTASMNTNTTDNIEYLDIDSFDIYYY